MVDDHGTTQIIAKVLSAAEWGQDGNYMKGVENAEIAPQMCCCTSAATSILYITRIQVVDNQFSLAKRQVAD